MINYYKAKYKKKSDTNLSNNNNAIYVNELFAKNSLKNKPEFKFRTTKKILHFIPKNNRRKR